MLALTHFRWCTLVAHNVDSQFAVSTRDPTLWSLVRRVPLAGSTQERRALDN